MITCNDIIISAQEIIASSIWSQAWGLMFRRKQNLIMIFSHEKQVSLHMWFVFFPIDVLILNEKKQVVEIKRNLKPFSLWSSAQKGKYVLELAFPATYTIGERCSFIKEVTPFSKLNPFLQKR